MKVRKSRVFQFDCFCILEVQKLCLECDFFTNANSTMFQQSYPLLKLFTKEKGYNRGAQKVWMSG